MRRLLKILSGLFFTLLLVAVLVPFVVPVDVLKDEAIARIEAMTGRKVRMGKVSLSVFPDIALRAENVEIGNPAWVKGGAPMAEVKTLRIGVELAPLLHKDVHVTDLTLEGPSIRLVKQGSQANWQFSAKTPADAKTKEAVGAGHHEAEKSVTPPVRLDSLSIRHGTLVFEDVGSGKKQSLAEVDMELLSKGLPASLSLSGSALVNGEKSHLEVTLSKPLGVMTGAPTEVSMKVGYGSLALSWEGTLALKGVPALTGKMAMEELNVASLTGKQEGKAEASPAKAVPVSTTRWSRAPISLEGLAEVNADLTLTVGRLVLPKIELANVVAHVQLQNGGLQLGLEELPLFGGKAKLDITARRTGALGLRAQIQEIRTEELLAALADSTVLTGVLTGNVALNTQGNSEQEMVAGLEGNGAFGIKDGTFKGGNLVNMTRNIATSFQAGGKGETTDFSSLAGSFTVKNGIVLNSDLKMESALLALTGGGQIDLPEWLVHYRLVPTMITKTGTETQAATGISVPVQVEGALDAPSYHPDLHSVVEEGLKDPQKFKENLKDVRKNLKNNLNKDTLKNLLGR